VPATTTDRSDEGHAETAESVESHIGSPTPSLVVLRPGAPQQHSQIRSLRSCVQRRPMSDREERSKPARCPDQFGYEHEWLWRMAPSLAPDRTCALRASSLATAGNGCCGMPLAAPLAMTRRGCVAACGDIQGIRQFTLGERSKVRGVGTTRCRLGGEFDRHRLDAEVLGEQADRQRADPAGRSDGDGEHHPLPG
jgi:hypothetical protein